MIRSFSNDALEQFFKHGNASWLPFAEPVLSQISELLVDLHVTEFSLEDLKSLYPIVELEGKVAVILTVNGLEQCGAVSFSMDAYDVFDVDLTVYE